ncbi:unnamed protein product [Caenorhabditis auriculariae]|uniref:Carboxylic ester hydrolase n=1 Tax=Caenorhabditis auriculariae TaxID=2777116 RepID=A0A8S1GV62_9PELO|nr:unnamed protein product [Caenorhabditis auriculariae]
MIITLFLLLCSASPSFELYVVNTSYGRLRGVTFRSSDGQKNHIFKSVPFVKPPLGKLRFKKPEEVEPWKGILDASTYSAACLSDSKYGTSKQKKISEDCLYLNIFTSERCLSSPCPVLIYLHGGAFNIDSAVMFPDQFIIDHYSSQGIVFVIPAMRLGVFGLLTFGDEEQTHQNLPVYDAMAAIKFVRSEISNFGGDPKRINLMGHSSGANLALLFATSSLIDPDMKLYHRVIALSAPMLFNDQNKIISRSMEIAENLGCVAENSTFDISQVVKCLQEVDATELLAAQKEMESINHRFTNFIFGPPFAKFNQTFEDYRSKIPGRDVMIGTTGHEMGRSLSSQENFYYGSFMDFENRVEVAEKFEADYKSGIFELADESQSIYVSAILYSAALTAAGGHVYLYESRQKPLPNHVSDMRYFIGIHRESNRTSDMDILESFYSKMLVNFTKYGDPSPSWDMYDSARRNFYAVEVDTKAGIYPMNMEDFHRNYADYWLINMTSFDADVTLKKLNNTPIVISSHDDNSSSLFPAWNETEIKDPINSTTIFSKWWFYLVIAAVVFTVISIVYCICRELCWKNEESHPLLR